MTKYLRMEEVRTSDLNLPRLPHSNSSERNTPHAPYGRASPFSSTSTCHIRCLNPKHETRFRANKIR
jgi:hypothetical protein